MHARPRPGRSPLSIRRASGAVSTTRCVDEDPGVQPVGRQVALERPGVTAQLLHRRAEGLAVGRVPAAARDLDPAAGALDVDQRDRVPVTTQHVDLVLAAVLKADVEVVQHDPVVRAVVAQVPDDGTLGVVDGLAAADDLSHRLSRPPPSACALGHHLAANRYQPHPAPPLQAVPAPGPPVRRPRPATGTPARTVSAIRSRSAGVHSGTGICRRRTSWISCCLLPTLIERRIRNATSDRRKANR